MMLKIDFKKQRAREVLEMVGDLSGLFFVLEEVKLACKYCLA